MIETPKNLTRNILLGLLLGFLVASFFYYTNFFPTTFKNFIQEYIFNLGGDIFLNLLKLIGLPLNQYHENSLDAVKIELYLELCKNFFTHCLIDVIFTNGLVT